MDRVTILKWIDVCRSAASVEFSVNLEGEEFVLRRPGAYDEQVAKFDNLIAVAAYLRGWRDRERFKAI
jgi:hypothetical protein